MKEMKRDVRPKYNNLEISFFSKYLKNKQNKQNSN